MPCSSPPPRIRLGVLRCPHCIPLGDEPVLVVKRLGPEKNPVHAAASRASACLGGGAMCGWRRWGRGKLTVSHLQVLQPGALPRCPEQAASVQSAPWTAALVLHVLDCCASAALAGAGRPVAATCSLAAPEHIRSLPTAAALPCKTPGNAALNASALPTPVLCVAAKRRCDNLLQALS